ncbi:SMP-30/gluconolactonase/LRE family protein [Neobacillus piezotolerans]|uniref:SMP-30/gluconolactonase/LRE family protein n=1 Tax=Neobacillus piezotolerans TaxID=2259171 RepID=A0A3D8GWJ1_9BACI|nr:SMP-30/gluconolactonase/LRE family protein [Neobacillus piezotolerans]RDU38827.1 SMP-30/gluconolactonase/LRE family protein [Neobacillus piezotolerans]
MQKEVELVVDAKAVLGEGPCWDRKSGALYWVDIEGKKVHVFNPGTGEDRAIEVGQMVGAIVPRESGGAVVALEKGFHFMNLETGELELICDPEPGLEVNRFNDGKCDQAGRFWAGTMDRNGAGEQGSLYCLEPSLSFKKKLGGLGISNGLAWSPDNRFLYFIDTPTGKVVRYKYDLESGQISEPKDVVVVPDGEGYPDGMTIDEEGFLWIAHWAGGKVSRWNPETGYKVSEIKVPAVNVTSCTFGGKDFGELYITTARNGMSDEELDRFPHAGGVFKAVPGVKGMPANEFKG